MMVKFKLGIPVIATVQKVGNKSREEGIAFASKADDMSFASEFVSTLVKNTFKFDTFSQFDSIDSLDMNPSYRFVRKIFEIKMSLLNNQIILRDTFMTKVYIHTLVTESFM